MNQTSDNPLDLVLALAGAWGRLERLLDNSLSGARGIRFADYRLLKALADAPSGVLRRVDLAAAVGLSASGVTRALRPLEKIGVIEPRESARDARLALSALTPAGAEMVADCSVIVEDVLKDLAGRDSSDQRTASQRYWAKLLAEFGAA